MELETNWDQVKKDSFDKLIEAVNSVSETESEDTEHNYTFNFTFNDHKSTGKPVVSKVHAPPRKQGIFGRKKYSEDEKTTDYVEFSFDDCWSAIEKLFVVSAALVTGLLLVIYKITGKEKR
jgi:hypothetical protein